MPSPSRHFRGFTIIELPAVRNRGFTIIELMVAISIIVILIAIIIPATGSMGKQTRHASAINSVSIAVEIARFHATRSIPAIDTIAGARYGGAAALVTATGEIRIIEHDQRIQFTNGTHLQPARKGYRDIPGVEYVRLPSQMAILGISRDGNNANDLRLFNPPFAITFNEDGHLVVTDLTKTPVAQFDQYNNHVFYRWGLKGSSSDPKARIGATDTNTSLTRPSNYNPADNNLAFDTTYSRYPSRFQRVESVMGVLVAPNEGLDLSENGTNGITTTTVRDALFTSGKITLFNRYTGTPMRDIR